MMTLFFYVLTGINVLLAAYLFFSACEKEQLKHELQTLIKLNSDLWRSFHVEIDRSQEVFIEDMAAHIVYMFGLNPNHVNIDAAKTLLRDIEFKKQMVKIKARERAVSNAERLNATTT